MDVWEWYLKCREKGEPVCYYTSLPYKGRDVRIKRVDHPGFMGMMKKDVVVLGEEPGISYDAVEAKEKREEPKYLVANNIHRCPNCNARYFKPIPFRHPYYYHHEKVAFARWVEVPTLPRFACSQFCERTIERTIRNARLREKRATTKSVIPCARCGEGFFPTRTDSKFCSGACRQKAYRQRKQPPSLTVDSAPTAQA